MLHHKFKVAVVAAVTAMYATPGSAAVLDWPDRRPIGSLFIAAPPQRASTNPRGYFFDRPVNINQPDDLRRAALAWADRAIGVLKNMNAQGMIVWDLEGEQVPPPLSYVGAPNQLPFIAPEMDAIADEFFGRFRSAGLKVGVTVRPQALRLGSDNVPAAQSDSPDLTAVVDTLSAKIGYARQRWGATLFYVDCNGDPYRPFDATVFERVLERFPDILLIPEHQNDAYWASTAPYMDLAWAGQFDYTSTPASVKLKWPKAFSVINANTGNVSAVYAELVQGVAAGDVLLFHGWYDDQPTNGIVKRVYEAAGRSTAASVWGGSRVVRESSGTAGQQLGNR